MYNRFCVIGIEASGLEKKLVISFNKDVDENSVGLDTIKLSSIDGEAVHFEWIVKENRTILCLDSWPDPANEYLLSIDAALSDISGTNLQSIFRKKITFPEEITSIVTIKSPYNFEKIDTLSFEITDSESIGSYYGEIASDNRFYNLVFDGLIFTGIFNPVIPDMKPGQYYARFRCQNGSAYGKWSRIISFIYKNVCDDDTPKADGPCADSETPGAWDNLFGSEITESEHNPSQTVEVEDELIVLTAPESGETPLNFVFEFDRALEPVSGEVIIIKREF